MNEPKLVSERSGDHRECGFMGCGSPRCEATCSPEPQGATVEPIIAREHNTPTDDGQEALDWALTYARRYWQHGGEPESQRALSVLVSSLHRYGSRCHEHYQNQPQGEPSSEVPEPSTDDRDPITDENLWDFADDLLDAWNIEDANAPSLAEDFRDRFVARFHPAYRPEPQGEPSDAQVQAALIAYWGGEKNAHLMGSMDGMRAALRAAGGVR